MEKAFQKLDVNTRVADKKKSLETIHKELERANSEVKTLQFEIKKCPEDK